jgi:hypothetical protein
MYTMKHATRLSLLFCVPCSRLREHVFSRPLPLKAKAGVGVCFALICLLITLIPTLAADTPAAHPSTQPATTQPTTQPAAPSQSSTDKLTGLADKLPGIKVDIKNKTVDIEASVATPDAKWLELLACTKGTREYESILTVTARPTHIHLALLMVGLEPGAPMQWLNQGQGNPIKVVPASGAKVKVTLIYEKDGKPVEVGANQWVLDAPTQKPLADDIWLFCGSRIGTEGKDKIYYADASGAVLTLVNFGDDLLTKPNNNTSKDGNDHFAVNPAAIPPKDTKVTIRLQPAK